MTSIQPVRRLLERLLHEEAGATAIEYGLIISFAGFALIAFKTPVNNKLQAIFGSISNSM